MKNIIARLMIVFAVALQDFVTARRIFERHERYIRTILCSDEEDERFFSYHALVVVHSAHAMVQHFSFTDKVSRTSCDDADKRAPFRVLQGHVSLRNGGKLRIQFLSLFRVFHSLCSAVFVNTDIVPAFEIAGQKVAIQRQVQPQMFAGFEIVDIRRNSGVLFCYVSKEFFKVFAFERFSYNVVLRGMAQAVFCRLIGFQFGKRTTRFVRPHYDTHIVVTFRQFFAVFNEPFAEVFVLAATL